MAKHYQLCGIGQAIVDEIVPVQEPFFAQLGLTKSSRSLVDDAKFAAFLEATAGLPREAAAGGLAVAVDTVRLLCNEGRGRVFVAGGARP